MTRCCCFLVGLVGLLSPALPSVADAPPGHYTVHASGTVYDTRTKLTWQQVVDAETYIWMDANTHCTNLSLAGTGWRLPTRAELLTLVDLTRNDPAIDSTTFPNTPATIFWSSTPYVASSGYAWSVNFSYGNSNGTVTSNAFGRVRCVR